MERLIKRNRSNYIRTGAVIISITLLCTVALIFLLYFVIDRNNSQVLSEYWNWSSSINQMNANLHHTVESNGPYYFEYIDRKIQFYTNYHGKLNSVIEVWKPFHDSINVVAFQSQIIFNIEKKLEMLGGDRMLVWLTPDGKIYQAKNIFLDGRTRIIFLKYGNTIVELSITPQSAIIKYDKTN